MSVEPKPMPFTCDVGGSGTKVYYRNGDRDCLQMMGPEVLEVPMSILQGRLSDFQVADPVNRAWLRPTKTSETCIVVGALASELKAQPFIKKAKVLTLLPKLQAMLGVMCEELELLDREVTIDLMIHLPWNEYQQASDLKGKIQKALSRFYFGERKASIAIRHFQVVPEGFGMIHLSGACQEKGMATQMVWSFGFRNSSFVTFEPGGNPRGATSSYGLCTVIDNLLARYGFTDRLEATRIVDLIQLGGSKNPPELRALTANMCATAREQQELQAKIISTIDAELETYWNLLQQWYRSNNSRPLGGVSVCGGTAALIEARIVDFFQEFKIYWGEPWYDTVGEVLERSMRDTSKLQIHQNIRRCLDIFGTGKYLVRAMQNA